MWFTNHINTSKITGCSPNLIYLLQGLWFVFQWFTSACCDKSLILNQWKTVPLNVRSAITSPADGVFPKSKAFLSLKSFSSIFSLCSWGHHSIKRWRADIENCKALIVFKVRYRLSKTTIKHFCRSARIIYPNYEISANIMSPSFFFLNIQVIAATKWIKRQYKISIKLHMTSFFLKSC